MNRKYFVIILLITFLSILFIFYSFLWKNDQSVDGEPVIDPPQPTYHAYIASVGVVEPKSGNIQIQTPISQVVKKIYVQEGEKIQEGSILFKLEDSEIIAELRSKKIAYEKAVATWQRLQSFPRKEDLKIAQALLEEAKAELEFANSQYSQVLELKDPRAVSHEEKNKRYFGLRQAEAKLKQAQAEYLLKQEGTWGPDLKIAELSVEQAEADIGQVRSQIEQTVIRAPISGTVLQINIHEGELTTALQAPLMVLGDLDEMHVRVFLNQLDIPSFNQQAKATAYLQDNSQISFPLKFVRVEPYLSYKHDFNYNIEERVDTKVLPIIYAIKKSENKQSKIPPLFVGQQLDVFIEEKNP